MSKPTTYDDLIEHNPKIGKILDPDIYKFVRATNKKTTDKFDKVWATQLKTNLKRYYKKHGLLIDNCRGFGLNKATIMIGAGPSFNKNKDFLVDLCQFNARFPFHEQPFLFMASNHQFKPCLEMGIIPHFVIMVDASDNLYDQLCRDIPSYGQHVTLLCAAHCHPKICKSWDRQGRMIQFYIPTGDDNKEIFKAVTGKEIGDKQMMQGGNVSNVAWMASMVALDSRVFMCVGNDLSYDIHEDVNTRRKSYYADGDYSTNLASKRDEAKGIMKWVGFDMYKNPFTDEYMIKFVPKGTTGSLFNYKTWMETYIAIQDVRNDSYHYYNCSEGGILGVVPKSYKKVDLEDVKNWVLLDEILPRRWHTQSLIKAATVFMEARQQCQTQREILTGARSVARLPQRIGTVNDIGQSIKALRPNLTICNAPAS